MHWDWDTFRAYISPVFLTIIAILGIAKDSKEYKKRADEPGVSPARGRLRKLMPVLLYILTGVLLIFGLFDIHGTRKGADDAKADRKTGEQQIETLQKTVSTGNTMLGQQRQDFLKQFSLMSDRVGQLQTQVKTADLQKQAAQLRNDLAATRKSLESPKAKLSFVLVSENGTMSKTVMLPRQANGTVRVKFSVENDTDVNAVDGVLVLMVCDACKIVGNPEGYTHLAGSPENTRNHPFVNVFAHSKTETFEAEIEPPASAPSFVLGIEYRCRSCDNYSHPQDASIQKSTLPPELIGTVVIQ
jgi:hypothetical protein